MAQKIIKPFGLLFEESVDQSSEFTIPDPIYDEEEDLSVFIDEEGNKHPYVEWNGYLGTKTATKTTGEGSDDDDLANNLFLRTKTMTEVKEEQSDEDDDLDLMRRRLSVLSTKTITRESGEETDEDEY